MAEFSVNYSPMLAEMVRAGQVRLDRFKCPAWPDLVAEARQVLPVYVHFPLTVGLDQNMPEDDERHRPADLEYFADLLEATGTPYINTHLFAAAEKYAGVPVDSLDPAHARRLIDGTLRDLEPLIRRFGAERVLVENCMAEPGRLLLTIAPEVFHRLLEESGCGLLLDLSHARLSSGKLGLGEREYIEMLPLERIREIHVTGIQVFNGRYLDLLKQVKDPVWDLQRMANRRIDHLSMVEEDWPYLEWAMESVRDGKWGAPWVVSYEYGGVGGFWDLLCERDVYEHDLPPMDTQVQKTRL